MYKTNSHFHNIFFFWSFPSIRGSTLFYLSPNPPVFNVRLLCTNFPIFSFTTSKNLLFRFLLFFFLGNFHHLLSYILLVSPHDMSIHLSLPSLIFIINHSTITVPLMYSFLILSFLVTPIANLNIFISATSISFTLFFVTATISSPYTIAVSPLNCTLFLLL